jgi:hypothetical protein
MVIALLRTVNAGNRALAAREKGDAKDLGKLL